MIDIQGDGFSLTDIAHGVYFDLDSDGTAQTLAWTARGSDDAFLVLDRNGNGIVDDGGEYLATSPFSLPLPNPMGFLLWLSSIKLKMAAMATT